MFPLVLLGWSNSAVSHEPQKKPQVTRQEILHRISELTPSNHVHAFFDEGIELMGYDIEISSLAPTPRSLTETAPFVHQGEEFFMTVYWKCVHDIQNEYEVILSFIGRNGQFNTIQGIGDPEKTDSWEIGQVTKERYDIDVPKWAGTGTYEIVLTVSNSLIDERWTHGEERSVGIGSIEIRPCIFHVPLDPELVSKCFGEGIYDLEKRFSICGGDSIWFDCNALGEKSALGIIAHTGWSGGIEQGMEIIRIEVVGTRGEIFSCSILQGIHTAETWYDFAPSKMRHEKVKVASSYQERHQGKEFLAHDYSSILPFPSPLQPTKIDVVFVNESGCFSMVGMVFID